MGVKRDIRESVKKSWRDLQRAQALSNRAVSQLHLTDKADKALPLEDEEHDEEEEKREGKDKAPTTVAFEREDDDPFGDCEVTTTAFDAPSSCGGLAANAAKLWPALLHTNISSAWASGSRDTWDLENPDEDEKAAAKFARQRRRAV